MWLLTSVVLISGVLAAECQFQYFAIPGDCHKFQIQVGEQPGMKFDLSCGPNHVFSETKKSCVDKGGLLDTCTQTRTEVATVNNCDEAAPLCANCPTCLYADASNCAGYCNCSKLAAREWDTMPAYQEECPYPFLFDAATQQCSSDFLRLEQFCGKRLVLKEPCDQKQFQCRTAHCRPCSVTYPSCSNKNDGIQEWEGRAFTPYFARCLQGRTMEAGRCATSRSGTPRVFHPVAKECVEVDGKTFFDGK